MTVSIDITDVTSVPMSRAAEFPIVAERMGFDGVGVRDNQATGRDAYIRLALAAASTSRVALFPAVGNPVTRHPAVLASVLNSLSELAPGRIRMVMGGGEGSVAHIGQKPARLDEVRHAVQVMRSLMAGGTISGQPNPHGRSSYVTDPAPPIYLNASSPRMLELAGEVGDGAMVLVGLHPAVVRRTQEHVEAGLHRAARSQGGFDISYAVPMFLDTRHGTLARQRAEQMVRGWLGRQQLLFTQSLGAIVSDHPIPSDPSQVSGALLATLVAAAAVAGTAEQCAEQLAAFVHTTGVEHIHLLPYGLEDDPSGLARVMERVVLPRVKGPGR